MILFVMNIISVSVVDFECNFNVKVVNKLFVCLFVVFWFGGKSFLFWYVSELKELK